MAIKPIETIKNFFKKGLYPTESNFEDLIDSCYNEGGGGSVDSVFTRTGAVVAESGDYEASQVTNALDKSSDNYLVDVVQGTNVTIDKTDPKNPIINSSGGGDSYKIESTSGDSIAEFGTGGANEYLTVSSSTIKVAQFGDGTHSKLIVDPDQVYGSSTGLWFGDGNTGFQESLDNNLQIFTAGLRWLTITSVGDILSRDSNSFMFDQTPPSGTNPNIIVRRTYPTTGLGSSGADQLSNIAGGKEMARFDGVLDTIKLYTLPTSAAGLAPGELYTQLPTDFGGVGTQKIVCQV